MVARGRHHAAGLQEAYRGYVEGGWGTLAGPAEHGGQGLPLTLAVVVMEDLGSANMGFSLVMMLDPRQRSKR